MRPTITLTLASALAGLAAFAVSTGSVAAQESGIRTSPTAISSQRRVRPRVVVTPSQRLYRQCVDVYRVEHRATGDTVVPDMRCRWAYR